ncbi:hypothetical protein V8E36_003209 [Tilletia maclaganii]
MVTKGSGAGAKPRKTRTREQQFKKQKKSEAIQRAASVAAAGARAATPRNSTTKAKAKSKGKVKAKDKSDGPSFHYVSFNDRLAAVHIDVARSQRSSAISGLDPLPGLHGTTFNSSDQSPDTATPPVLALFDSEDAAALADIDLTELSSTAFGTALVTWRELNQSLPFYAFVRRILPLSNSLPQLLHHAETISDALCELLGVSSAAGESARKTPATSSSAPGAGSGSGSAYLAYAPALDLIPRFAHDLQAEFLPFYPRSLEALLRTTQVNKLDTDGVDFLAADIVEAAFKATAGLLRIVAPLILAESPAKASEKGKERERDGLDQLQVTWLTLRPYLGWVQPKPSRASNDGEAFDDWDGPASDHEDDADSDDAASQRPDQIDEDAAVDDVSMHSDDDEEGEHDASTVPAPRHKQYRRRRVPPHTRRFASEAFAHLVRKAKGSHRLAHVAQFMLQDVATMRAYGDTGSDSFGALVSAEDWKGFESAVAGVWAEVIKSVDDHLHSSALHFIDAALLIKQNANAIRSDDATDSSSAIWRKTFPEARRSTGVLLLTALNHHSSAAQMLELIKHLAGLVETRVSAADLSTGLVEALTEAVVWLCTAVGVRKGSRVHDTLKGGLFALLVQLAKHISTLSSPWDAKTPDGALTRAILSLITLTFPIGRIQDLIGPGIKVMDALTPPPATMNAAHSYAQRSFAFNALVLALADPTLAWSGFRQFVMPPVLKHTVEIAAAYNNNNGSNEAAIAPLTTVLGLLASLQERGELGPAVNPAAPTPAIGKWLIQVGNALKRRLGAYAQGSITELLLAGVGASSDTARARFLAELALLPIFAHDFGDECVETLGTIIKYLLDSGLHDPEIALDAYRKSPLNTVHILASVLGALSKLLESTSSGSADARKRVSKSISALFFAADSRTVLQIVQGCGFHTPTLRALCDALTAARPMAQEAVPHSADIVASPVIAEALSSIENDARLASCELVLLLSRLGPTKDTEAIFYEGLLDVERTPLSIESVRERNVRMRAAARSLVQALKSISKGTEAPAHLQQVQTLTIVYIVGSLKLNFRPVWSECVAALVDLTAVCGDEVWRIAFAQLDIVQDPVHASLKSASWTAEPRSSAVADDGDTEGETLERVFRDPVLQSRLGAFSAVFEATGGAAVAKRDLYPQDAGRQQLPRGRLDAVNYHDQILKLFGEVPRLAEKHNAPLVQRFFSIVSFDVDEEQQPEEDDAVKENTQLDMPQRGFLERRAQLCSFLELFGKFGNPKALLRSEDLHNYFLELCASGDLKVQQLALACILTWKNPAQTPYADSLKNLLDPSAFREELMQFNLEPESNIIQAQHRSALMPLLVRLLYGQIISRRGKATTGAGKHSRKHAILSALALCAPDDLDVLVELMLRPFQDQLPTFDASSNQMQFSPQPSTASRKRQVGFLSLLADVLKHVGQLVSAHWPNLLGVTLNLGHHAARLQEVDGVETSVKGGRAVRRTVYQRLGDFSRRALTLDWMPFLIPTFDSLINAQAQLLRVEASQAPTALLELLYTWSERTDTMLFLSSVNKDIPRHLLACLSVPAASGQVVSRVLEIFERVIAASLDEDRSEEDREAVRAGLLTPYLGDALAHAGALLERLQKAKVAGGVHIQGRDDLLKRTVAMLAAMAPYVERPSDAELLLKLLIPMLQQSRALDERIKKDLLSIFTDLSLKAPSFHDVDSEFFGNLLEIMSSMFAALRTRPARSALVAAFRNFGIADESLKQATVWIEDLNAYSSKRLEEPDFDRRLGAFFQITESDPAQASAQVWTPLLHNMIFFVQDAEELAIRTNAAAALRQFFGLVASRMEDEAWQRLLLRVALPALRKVMRSKSDLVRREALSLLASAIETLPEVPALAQMKGLLYDGDGEANFFNNIVHLQVHRRVRALRRLGDEVEKGNMSGKLVKETFIPLVNLFLDPALTSDQQLINEAINCMGRLAGALTWYGYQALVWSLIKSAREHPINEKVVVRTLMTVLDNFRFDLKATITAEKPLPGESTGIADDDADEDVDEEEVEAQAKVAQSAKISDAVTGRLLPALMGFLESRDNTDDAIRLPVAVGVARLALKLPTVESNARINKLLNTLTGALKSKSQETRDLTREVFLKVARTLGPTWLLPISTELKKGLTRGPQIAVAAFTFHAVLVHMMDSSEAPLQIIDAEMPTIMSIVSDDLFGLTSEDRENADYKSKHREVRQGKSLDTLERVSKLAAPHRVATILLPLREVLERTEAQRPLRMVDDALRRIASGLIVNDRIEAHTFLILCHSLISGNARFLQTRAKAAPGTKTAVTGIDNGVVLHKRKSVEGAKSDANHYSRNAHRFIAFGLDLLLSALKRGRFSFEGVDDSQQQLLPLVKSVGNALYSSQASIVQLALRATAELVKSPLQKVTESLPALIKQIFSIISSSGSAQSETVQTAFKTLTTIIRERKDAAFQEKQLADLLRLILPELEDSGVQWVIFGLLRAIIGRRFVIAEVYDVMAKVAEMMVTSQSSSARENCRSLMLQFLLEYPQGKGRLKHQMSFLAKNLSYVYESGRLSVMELLRAILGKFDEGALQPFHELLLVALVMIMANDDSETCRVKAGELIRTIVGQQSSEARSKTVTMAHSWAQQPDRPQLSCVALQLYSIFLDGKPAGDTDWLRKAMDISMTTVREIADDLVALQDQGTVEGLTLDFKLPLASLQAVARLFKADATLLDLSKSLETWPSVEAMLLFPHDLVRLAAGRLLGAMFASLDTSKATESANDPLAPAHLLEVGRKLAQQLAMSPLTDDLSLQTVKNLLFVGRQLAGVSTVPADPSRNGGDDDVANGQDDEDDEAEPVGDEDNNDDEEDVEEDEELAAGLSGPSSDGQETASNPLGGLFSKLSFQARNSVFASGQRLQDYRWHVQPSAILRWFAAMTTHLDADVVKTYLPHMLTPIFYITDDTTIKDDQIEEIKGLAMEVQTLIQEKVGASAFSQTYSKIRQRALSKRRERKTAKLMTTISRPDAAAKRKSKVNARKHDSRKRKAQHQADQKVRNKPIKRHRTAV